jgi:copper chaperone CopZ
MKDFNKEDDMKKLLLTTALLTILSTSAFAAETVKIKVDGMVCDFCAQSVLKVFEKNEGVDDIAVSLDDQLVTITMKEGATLTDEEIKKNIHYSGYDLVSVDREESE